MSGNPFDFAAPEVEFKKLDDLPGKGKGKPNTAADIMKAMAVLHKMIHAQAAAYGGKNSKLLPAGIAEGSLLQQVSAFEEEYLSEDKSKIDFELEKAYKIASALVHVLAKNKDEDSLKKVLDLIAHINAALSEVHRKG